MRYIAVIILALLIACAPQVQQAKQDTPKPINHNPQLTLGECNNVWWWSESYGQVWVRQCVPDGYSLYEHRLNADGEAQKNITVPLQIDWTGAAFSILPGGRAGRIGYTTDLTRFDPDCYAIKIIGQLHLWGVPEDYGAGVIVGEEELTPKRLPANGAYELAWFWLSEGETLTDVTFYLSFAWGSATADSYATIERFEIAPVTLAHCG